MTTKYWPQPTYGACCHEFDADHGPGDYGQDFDLPATQNFGRYWNVPLAYARYTSWDLAPPALSAAG